MPTIADLVVVATEYGVFEFYLPFLIMFALFYGLLTKMNLFGGKEKAGQTDKSSSSARLGRAVNLIISLSASMFLMAYTPLGVSLASFLSGMFGQTALILITLVCAGLVLYVLGVMAGFDIFGFTKGDEKKTPGGIKFIVIVVGLVVAAMVVSNSGILLPGIVGDTGITIPGLDITAQDAMIIGLIILTVVAIWFVVREPSQKTP
jgi:hypothetical protein